MPTDSPVMLLMALAAGCLPALLVLASALRLRWVLGRRLQRLEDALRVYNSANAELGRQLREMEDQFRIPAPRSAAARGAESPRAAPAGAATGDAQRGAQSPRVPPTAVARRQSAPADADFSESELRLARLLKSRLPAMRAG